MNASTARALTGMTAAGIAALALQPVLTQRDVLAVMIPAAQAATLSLTVSGGVLLIGWTAYKLEGWQRQLPPKAPTFATAPVTFDAAAAESPQLVAEAAHLMATEPQPDADHYAKWEAGLLRFALFTGSHSWGWREMAPLCSRSDWKTCTKLLMKAGLIRHHKGKTQWAPGLCFGRFRAELKAGIIHIDYPPPREQGGADPPSIYWKRTLFTSSPYPRRQIFTGAN